MSLTFTFFHPLLHPSADQRAGTMLMSRAADDAVRKLTLVKPLIE